MSDPNVSPPALPLIQEPQAAGQRLKELFPALFTGAPKPIMLKVQQAIEARSPGVFSKKALSGFLARHTASTSYLIAITKSEQRFDLDGQPAGALSEDHREAARLQLAQRRQRQREREQEMENARRWRLDLLRSFETSRISRANFCALKGVDDAQLDALLEQARQERQERPARDSASPRTEERRNHAPRRR